MEGEEGGKWEEKRGGGQRECRKRDGKKKMGKIA